jgi:predicted  nucleic acid-binding Zn-ribbon protein
MPSPTLEKLLVLQDRDIKRLGLERQLKAVPLDIAAVEGAIAAEKDAIENARAEIKNLETSKKMLETEIGSAEATLGKYRTQQLSVRKNDEYQALGHEIELTQAQIGELEGRELEVMYSIDEAKRRFAAAEATLKQNIAGHEARIGVLRERGEVLAASLKAAQEEVAAARGLAEESGLRAYDRMAARGMPVVVPVHDGKCGGCHLKVSSEVESAARGKGPPGELPICDQCNRIVYWEAT